MKVKVVDEECGTGKYHIRPEDINISRQFYCAFGWAEVEILANYLVRFFQKIGMWRSFTPEEINKFWVENSGKEEALFNKTNKFPFYCFGEKLLMQGRSGKYRVTNYFIDRCFQCCFKGKSS